MGEIYSTHVEDETSTHILVRKLDDKIPFGSPWRKLITGPTEADLENFASLLHWIAYEKIQRWISWTRYRNVPLGSIKGGKDGHKLHDNKLFKKRPALLD